MNFEERELCKFLETYYKREVKRENYKYFGDDKFVLLPIDLLNENFGFSAYKLRIKFKNISEKMPFQTRLGQGRQKYFAFKGEKPTNFQRIKKMSVDEMAKVISTSCLLCPYNCDVGCTETNCFDGIKQWLLQECE